MADQIYVSWWVPGFTAHNMLRHYDRLLRLFPLSKLNRNPSTLRVVPVDYAQPALLERPFTPPIQISDIIAASKEFQHADTSYQFETWWDLWQYVDDDWQLAPARVTLSCLGPEFEKDLGENLRVDFGLDTHFIPQPDLAGSIKMAQSNLQSLNHFIHEADAAFTGARRQLWTESGENFADMLQRAISDAR